MTTIKTIPSIGSPNWFINELGLTTKIIGLVMVIYKDGRRIGGFDWMQHRRDYKGTLNFLRIIYRQKNPDLICP